MAPQRSTKKHGRAKRARLTIPTIKTQTFTALHCLSLETKDDSDQQLDFAMLFDKVQYLARIRGMSSLLQKRAKPVAEQWLGSLPELIRVDYQSETFEITAAGLERFRDILGLVHPFAQDEKISVLQLDEAVNDHYLGAKQRRKPELLKLVDVQTKQMTTKSVEIANSKLENARLRLELSNARERVPLPVTPQRITRSHSMSAVPYFTPESLPRLSSLARPVPLPSSLSTQAFTMDIDDSDDEDLIRGMLTRPSTALPQPSFRHENSSAEPLLTFSRQSVSDHLANKDMEIGALREHIERRDHEVHPFTFLASVSQLIETSQLEATSAENEVLRLRLQDLEDTALCDHEDFQESRHNLTSLWEHSQDETELVRCELGKLEAESATARGFFERWGPSLIQMGNFVSSTVTLRALA
ncbi:unnamed protein product [Mycena citricolor]|uniref:Uncharacterized protein n=1 Tax=Mycena citricolor TaxID=2018698 RepID=A0AAD2K6H4_9AGAR|nr:unnamed protein product [Mycena citricolor]